MKNKIVFIACGIAIICLIVGFEGTQKKLNNQIKINEKLQNDIEELQNEKDFWKFGGTIKGQVCPTCGSSNLDLNEVVGEYYIRCKICGMTSGHFDTVQEAVKSWNSLRIENEAEE